MDRKLFAEVPEVRKAVGRALMLFSERKRGEVVPWADIEGAAGFERYTRHWSAFWSRLRRDFMGRTGICLWPEVNVGAKLLTIEEQLNARAVHRRRKAFRQLRRDQRELDALPNAELSDRQREVKARQLSAAREAKRQVLRQLRVGHALSKPSSSGQPRVNPGRPLPAR